MSFGRYNSFPFRFGAGKTAKRAIHQALLDRYSPVFDTDDSKLPAMEAYAEAQKHPSAVVVLIGLPGGSQDWWHFAYQHATQVRTLDDRVQYIPPAGIEDKGNSRESWLFVYRRKVVACPAQIVRDDWRARIQK